VGIGSNYTQQRDIRTFCTHMKILTETIRIRFSKDDKLLMKSLKKYRIKPTTFIREAFREKVQREKPKILEAERKRIQSIECPF
jgi:hypothetical protein